jgi:protoporphyrinogen oxidase
MINSVMVIGAGPAGLTAAYELLQQGIRPSVLERADKVGGIARTECYDGFRFDIGGHRFFTRDQEVDQLWHQMLGEDLLPVERLSRIAYRGRFFDYPLDISSTLSSLGVVESLLLVLSYIRAKARPYPQEETFEQWVTNRFGHRLYEVFFKTYTEKVWGIPCDEIRADWAAQRIKGLSLRVALLSALLGNNEAKTLIDQFHYPALGPGMMWERFRRSIEEGGGEVRLNTEAVSLVRSDSRIEALLARSGDQETEWHSDAFISSMPLPELIARLDPPAPQEVATAAQGLRYRSFLIVGLIVDHPYLFPDNWIYLHSPEVRAGRIQNMKNWSPAMVPDPHKTSLGVEYFCDEGDEVWTMGDADLIALATDELELLGLLDPQQVEDGVVFRQSNAYPVYDSEYQKQRSLIRDFLSTIENLQTIGRNGIHRYNNMDHSMRTGLLAARNVVGATHDVWEVNEEAAYLEEGGRELSQKERMQEMLAQAFARLDAVALGVAVGVAVGLALFLATMWLIVKGGEVVGPTLDLLGQFFPGYSVTTLGAVTGLGYGFVCGFVFGWSLASLRNLVLSLHLYRARRTAELRSLRDFLDHS